MPLAREATERLTRDGGFELFVVTNQPDVARGRATAAEIERMHEALVAMLPIREVRACFHDGSDECSCRKPKPGMLTDAARDHGIDLRQSFMVGDRWSDVLAGQAAGCESILIETPYSKKEKCSPDHVAADLMSATDWILARIGSERMKESLV